jgi:hypothetical protein
VGLRALGVLASRRIPRNGESNTMACHGRLARLGWLLLLLAPAPALAAASQDAWDAIYVGRDKVGHTHIKVAPVKDKQGKEYLRVQVNTVLSFKRGKDRANMEVRYGTIETKEGSVLRLDTRTLAGRDEIKVAGDVVNGEINLSIEGGGQRQSQRIPWGDDVRGPYGAELSLSRDPIQPGQTRDIRIYIPDMNRICTTHLQAKDREKVTLGGDVSRELLRIEQSITGADGKPMPELDTTFWIDQSGQILKSHTNLLGGMTSYRTTEAAAKAPNGQFDLLAATIMRVTQPIPDSEKARDIVYRVQATDADVKSLLPTDQRQTLSVNGRGTAVLEVKTDGTQTGQPGSATVNEEFLRPNPLINSDDPVIQEKMREAVGERTDPWLKAIAIENWVHKYINNGRNFETAFASASEVVRTRTGDCSEHGVLTAALCRAAGIPTRCVVGLVYVDKFKGFGPHLWNEVYVNGRWVAIDATWDQAQVDATHIKIADSSLDGVAPFDAFLPVLRVVDKVKIEPVEIR